MGDLCRFQLTTNSVEKESWFVSNSDFVIEELAKVARQRIRCRTFVMAIDEVVAGWESGDRNREERGWKLFFLVLRMLLHRPRGGGLIARKKLQGWADKFSRGSWVDLARSRPKQSQCAGIEEVTEMKTTEPHEQRNWQWSVS